MEIILSDVRGGVSAAPDAETIQREILGRLQAITAVSSETEQNLAVGVIRSTNEVLTSVAKTGNEIRTPIRVQLQKVLTIESGFCNPIFTEVDRVKALLVQFHDQEEIRKAQLELAKQEEIRRLQAQEADLHRAAEAIAAAPDVSVDDAAEVMALRDKAEDAAVEAISVAMTPVLASVKPKGVSAPRPWKWEFTDKNAAYAAHPEFFELTEKKLVIRDAVSEGGFSCPGMRCWQETRIDIRKQ